MSSLELTELYQDLKKRGHDVIRSSSLIVNCEEELTELMKQIDLMNKAKKKDWYKEKAMLELKLETKSREITLQQESLDRKNSEIARLRDHISQAEKGDKKIKADYQMQIEQLHKDLSSLKKQYERMRIKHQKERVKLTSEKHEFESNGWTTEKKQLNAEIDRLTLCIQSLNEKCDLLEQQGASYEDQLAKRKQLIGDIEANLRMELSQVRLQLHEVEDRESERNLELARLKADLTHWKNKHSTASQELQAKEAALKKASSNINNLKLQNESFSAELKTQGTNLHRATVNQLNQEKEIVKMKELLQEKENTIQSLLMSHKVDESSKVQLLQNEVSKIESQFRDLRAREESYKREVSQLRADCEALHSRLCTSDKECVELRDQLHAKTKELMCKEENLIKTRENNIADFQHKVSSMKSLHEVEVAALRNELELCRQELASAVRTRYDTQHSFTLSTSGSPAKATSPSLYSNSTKLSEELSKTQRSLEHLRLENQQLRNQIISDNQIFIDKKKVEDLLATKQSQHDSAAIKLQLDNENLKAELIKLKQDMVTIQDEHHKKYQKLLRDMQRDFEKREALLAEEHSGELKLTEEKALSNQQFQGNLINHQLNTLRAENEALAETLSAMNENLGNAQELNEALSYENSLMSSFAENMAKVVSSSSRQDVGRRSHDNDTTEFLTLRHSPDPLRRLANHHSPGNPKDGYESHLWSSFSTSFERQASGRSSQTGSMNASSDGSSIAERFLEGQKERTAALTLLLNQHLKDVRVDFQSDSS